MFKGAQASEHDHNTRASGHTLTRNCLCPHGFDRSERSL